MLNLAKIRNMLEEKGMKEKDIEDMMIELVEEDLIEPATPKQFGSEISNLKAQIERSHKWEEKAKLAAKIISLQIEYENK